MELFLDIKHAETGLNKQSMKLNQKVLYPLE